MNSIIIRLLVISSFLFGQFTSAQANVLLKQNDDQSNQEINIPINAPAELDFLSKKGILARRDKYVQSFRSLLADQYQPDPSVFQLLEDNKPWWGMHGAFIWGAGQHSIDGAAEESRFILNPFLLVGVNPGTALIWRTDKINREDLTDANFPLCWLPTSLAYFPGLSLAQTVYSISGFNQQIKLHADKLRFNPDRLKLNQFGLVAYNARDFGFQYIYVDIAKSINVVNINGCSAPVLIKQMIHCGNSAKYPGGCNNMSPAMPEIDRFGISSLPARACVYLWKEKPSSVTQKADFTFYLDFR